jgi:hypothetical protein
MDKEILIIGALGLAAGAAYLAYNPGGGNNNGGNNTPPNIPIFPNPPGLPLIPILPIPTVPVVPQPPSIPILPNPPLICPNTINTPLTKPFNDFIASLGIPVLKSTCDLIDVGIEYATNGDSNATMHFYYPPYLGYGKLPLFKSNPILESEAFWYYGLSGLTQLIQLMVRLDSGDDIGDPSSDKAAENFRQTLLSLGFPDINPLNADNAASTPVMAKDISFMFHCDFNNEAQRNDYEVACTRCLFYLYFRISGLPVDYGYILSMGGANPLTINPEPCMFLAPCYQSGDAVIKQFVDKPCQVTLAQGTSQTALAWKCQVPDQQPSVRELNGADYFGKFKVTNGPTWCDGSNATCFESSSTDNAFFEESGGAVMMESNPVACLQKGPFCKAADIITSYNPIFVNYYETGENVDCRKDSAVGCVQNLIKPNYVGKKDSAYGFFGGGYKVSFTPNGAPSGYYTNANSSYDSTDAVYDPWGRQIPYTLHSNGGIQGYSNPYLSFNPGFDPQNVKGSSRPLQFFPPQQQ